uniref:NR LBD domain-containing protein n=1 Tax=Angiostrongylus cantonensis TaxID=6313 RepID=A0A0K0D2Z2_ANGCA
MRPECKNFVYSEAITQHCGIRADELSFEEGDLVWITKCTLFCHLGERILERIFSIDEQAVVLFRGLIENLFTLNGQTPNGAPCVGMATFTDMIHASLDGYIREPIKTDTEKLALLLFKFYNALSVKLPVKLDVSQTQ